MPETTRRPIGWFKISPQVRTDLGNENDLRNLGHSLLQRQLSPLGAMADGELIYGFRRLRAATLVGMKDLAVTIYTEPLTPAEIKIIQLTENIHRLDMNPFDKWSAYEELRRLNPEWTAKELAERLKLDPSAVTKWLSPSKCIPAWRDALKAGRVGISDCYAASQAGSEAQQQEMLAMKLTGATRDTLHRAVQRKKHVAVENAARLARITIPLLSGTKVVISGNDLTLVEVVETLNECLKAAHKGLKERLSSKTWQSGLRDQLKSTIKGEGDA